MTTWNHRSAFVRSAGFGYLFALLATVVAIAVRWLLDPWLGHLLALVTLYAAVAASVWVGGYRPAILAVIVGYLSCDYLFIDPRGSIGSTDSPNLIGLAAYLLSSSIIIAFGEGVRREQARAKTRQALLQTTLASISDAVITTDPLGNITYMNAAAAALTGWDPSEAAGRPVTAVFRIVNERSRLPVEDPVARVLKQGRSAGLANHTLLLSKDGKERPIDHSAASIRDAQGHSSGAIVVFHDITARRDAEISLRRSEHELSDFFESASVGLHWVGPTGTILRVNRAELELLGYGHDEYVGHSIVEFHVDRPVIDDILARLARGETLREHPARMRCKDGSILVVLINSSALFEDGKFVHSRCFTQDVTDRDQAQKARTALAAIVEASDDAIVSKTLDGEIVSWNKGAERLFGYTEAEAVGKSIGIIIPSDLQDEERMILGRLRRGERIDHFETVRVKKDGQRIDISLTVSPIRDVTGCIIGASKVARDISPRKRAERSLRESEQRFRLLADAAPVLIWVSGVDMLRTWFNQRWLEFVGRSMAQELGNGWTENVHPDDFERCMQTYKAAFAAREPFSMEYRLRRYDEKYRWVLDHGVPRYEPEGAFAGYIGSCLDITDHRLAEAALEETMQQLKIVTECMSAPVTRCNRDLRYVWVSKPYADWLGRTPEEMVGQEIVEILGPEAFARLLPSFQKVMSGERVHFEDEVSFRGIGARWVNAVYTPTVDSRGSVEGWVAVVIDVTERKRMENRLREADRLKDEFLATLAHELRNPIAPIRNALEIMKRPESSVELVGLARSTVERQTVHMVRLIDDLLDVSRITRQRMELKKERVELASIIHHAVEACRPLAEAAGHELIVALAPGIVYVDGDPVRLAQVFGNLLTNACKYTDPGGRIWLTTESTGNEVVASVKDTGVGIAHEMLPHVFEMFSQIGPSLERSQGGLGIGLSLVKRLVELHGGSVMARSAGLGHGSEFIVRLPVLPDREAQPAQQPSRTSDAASLPSQRILIVDDNADGAESLAMLLRLAGQETQTARDGVEAVEKAASFRPDVILLDIGLPKLNGYEVCRALRQEPWGKEIMILALTGWGQAEDRRKSKEAGFDHHLVKPVDHAALMRLLAERATRQ